jgi:hypothetical protein
VRRPGESTAAWAARELFQEGELENPFTPDNPFHTSHADRVRGRLFVWDTLVHELPEDQPIGRLYAAVRASRSNLPAARAALRVACGAVVESDQRP